MLNIELDPEDITSPKRKEYGDLRAISDWYGYYAGYSASFVRDVLSVYAPEPSGLILDPWNGAGTTTAIASLLGFPSYGCDLNPAVGLISRARSARDVSLAKLTRRVEATGSQNPLLGKLQLPLFSVETNVAFENLRNTIMPGPFVTVEQLSTDDCVLLTALFLTARKLACPHQGSNPTWWKSDTQRAVTISVTELRTTFLANLKDLLQALDLECVKPAENPVEPIIRTGSVQQIPLADAAAAMVITSPPYLTRLDYVKAMRYELGVLYGEDRDLLELRRKMMGSVMGGDIPTTCVHWGTEAAQIINHALQAALVRKRGDGQYYSGTFARYFAQMHDAIKEINRILKPGGKAVFVVQGSRHRGRVVDLPTVVQQMGAHFGWTSVRAVAWPTRDLARINSHSRSYGNHTVHETALVLSKP